MAERVERAFGALGASASIGGRAVTMILAALSTYHAGMPQVVIAGEPGAADTRALTDVVRSRYMPTAVTVPISEAHRPALARVLPWTSALVMREGKATVYVCRDFACQVPATSAAALEAQLTSWTSR
jgi:uncharacterized protein YyaL (SSP411 family)